MSLKSALSTEVISQRSLSNRNQKLRQITYSVNRCYRLTSIVTKRHFSPNDGPLTALNRDIVLSRRHHASQRHKHKYFSRVTLRHLVPLQRGVFTVESLINSKI